jgi:hypothetical protein
MYSWEQVFSLVSSHFSLRPRMMTRDVYKLLYQGVFGVGHIMGPGAWDYLKREGNSLDLNYQPEESLMESVSLDCSVVRVNLRPFLRGGYSLKVLMEAMKASNISGKASEFLALWDVFRDLVLSRRLALNIVDVDEINKLLDRTTPQPMHHTPEYREAYCPAYRVVSAQEIQKKMGYF